MTPPSRAGPRLFSNGPLGNRLPLACRSRPGRDRRDRSSTFCVFLPVAKELRLTQPLVVIVAVIVFGRCPSEAAEPSPPPPALSDLEGFCCRRVRTRRRHRRERQTLYGHSRASSGASVAWTRARSSATTATSHGCRRGERQGHHMPAYRWRG